MNEFVAAPDAMANIGAAFTVVIMLAVGLAYALGEWRGKRGDDE